MAQLINTRLYRDSSLIGYWRMEGNSNDSSPSGNNGTDSNMSYSFGKYIKSADFNGTNSKITATATAYGNDGTFCFWMKTNFNNTTDTNQYNIIDYSGSPRAFVFFYFNTNFGWDNPNGVIDPISYSFGNISGQWHHWAFVWSGGNSEKIYYDGVQIATASVATSNGTPTSLYIGTRFNDVNWFPGSFDDVAIFNKALSQSEISLLVGGEAFQLLGV